jgi:hypothetical protein
MRTFAVAAALSLVSAAAVARAHAQEPAAPAPAEQEKERTEARTHLQVLQNPYEISSFYRSSPSPVGFGYEPMTLSRYPIASFYRSQHAPGAYGMFWTSGYGNAYGMSRGRGRGPLGVRRTRPLGLNGDLCLFAPTFLAPVGPLTGAFFESR